MEIYAKDHTIEFRRATLAPFARTLAKATLPKLPSPISLITSNRSSRAVKAYEVGLWLKSVTTILPIMLLSGNRRVFSSSTFVTYTLRVFFIWPALCPWKGLSETLTRHFLVDVVG